MARIAGRGLFDMVRCCGAGLWFLVLMGGVARRSDAQDATVVFYSHGSALTSELPGSNHGIFYGCVYDGAERLACFQDGLFIKNNRFAVFRLPQGAHVFSASYSGKHPAKHSQLLASLEAGKTYFFRAQTESRGTLVIGWDRGRLDAVSCQTGQQETANAKPLTLKHISVKAAALLSPAQEIPSCP